MASSTIIKNNDDTFEIIEKGWSSFVCYKNGNPVMNSRNEYRAVWTCKAAIIKQIEKEQI